MSSQEGFSNLDYPAEVEQFIPSVLNSNQRANRRGHVVSFCGGIIIGALALLAIQWFIEIL